MPAPPAVVPARRAPLHGGWRRGPWTRWRCSCRARARRARCRWRRIPGSVRASAAPSRYRSARFVRGAPRRPLATRRCLARGTPAVGGQALARLDACTSRLGFGRIAQAFALHFDFTTGDKRQRPANPVRNTQAGGSGMTTATDVAWLDARAQAALVRDGEVSPLELVEGAISRIERLNPTLNAVIFERFEQARREAADGTLPDGPFRGVPFLMKDIIQTVQGEPHSMGWKTLKDLGFRAPLTSYVAQKFIDAGLVRLGQTTVPEWGPNISAETAAWGATRNPWNPERAAGGSSTGAAVAVASGMVPIAHANDAGGSI